MGEEMMDLWWIPVGIVAWILVAVVIGLRIGAVLRRCSEVRESVDKQWGEASGAHEPRRDERQASPGRPGQGASNGEPVLDIPLARAPAIIRQREASIVMREQNVTL
jgi:hypothetical protein